MSRLCVLYQFLSRGLSGSLLHWQNRLEAWSGSTFENSHVKNLREALLEASELTAAVADFVDFAASAIRVFSAAAAALAARPGAADLEYAEPTT